MPVVHRNEEMFLAFLPSRSIRPVNHVDYTVSVVEVVVPYAPNLFASPEIVELDLRGYVMRGQM